MTDLTPDLKNISIAYGTHTIIDPESFSSTDLSRYAIM